jgi:anti-sigma factor RsiW
MSPRRHLDDLFSSAYEDELSPIDEARFQGHMQSCAPCADAYAEFRASIEALRELPRARMPQVVHLPSTPPVAQRPARPTIGLSWFNLGLVRRFPATAIAGGFAIVLVIAALAHGTGGTPAATSGPSTNQHSTALVPGSAVTTTACTQIVAITGASPPVSFTQEDLATDPAQPAVHLVLAAPTLVVTPGKPVLVYAQLSVPVATISNPGSAVSSPVARAVLPCVSVGVGTANAPISFGSANPADLQIPQAAGAGSIGGAPEYQAAGASGPLLTFVVPAGTAANTEIHVTATIPAGFSGPNSPALKAELTLTTG